MKKKKLLFCAYDLDIGGIEKALINLLNNIDYSKYEVTLILEKKEGIFLNKINKYVKIIEYKIYDDKNIIIRKIKNFVKRFIWKLKNNNKYDFSCVYATYSFMGCKLSLIASKNSYLYIHSNYKYIYDDKKEIINFFTKRNYDKFKKVIFVANEAKNDFLDIMKYDKSKCLVINNLINDKEILELANENINIKRLKNKKLFVFIGRLEEDSKQITKLINLVQNISDIELWIVGDGPNRNLYESIIKKDDNIKLLGSKANPYPYIKCADYVILTSKYEGFPVVYNEAIVLNKKIITTIDVSDDYISIPNRFGYIISKDKDKMILDVKNILKNDNLKVDKLSFKKINNDRMKRLEKLFDGDIDDKI